MSVSAGEATNAWRLSRTAPLLCCATALTLACSPAEDAGSARPQSPAPVSANAPTVLESREGRASYVGQALNGARTASGVAFDAGTMVAAHPTYPFETLVRVTNLENDRHVDVRIVDRGPADTPRAEGVIIDLSRAAADALGFVQDGRARVRVDVLRWGTPDDQR